MKIPMEPTKEARSKLVQEMVEALAQKVEKAKPAIYSDLLNFLVSMGVEGERSAVVLGAERINVSLENMLQKFLRPCPKERDTLFASDGPLGTFSRKIEMAFRLGLIDSKFKQALDMIRRLRNNFAHATTVESLQDQKHAERVKALWKLMLKGNEPTLKGFATFFQQAAKDVRREIGEQTANYLSCVMSLLVKLELVSSQVEQPFITMVAKLDYKGNDPD